MLRPPKSRYFAEIRTEGVPPTARGAFHDSDITHALQVLACVVAGSTTKEFSLPAGGGRSATA